MMKRRFRPSLGALQAFEAAARHGSFTRAAYELSLTQGAISRQIRGLEAALGIRLFELVRRRVVLTELGQTYLVDVRRTLDGLEDATLRVMAQGGGGDVLELASLPTFCARWLIPRLPQFYAQHPGIQINCTTRLSPFEFENEPFDAAIHYGPPVWPGAVLDHLFDERMVAVCSPEFATRHAIRGPEDLAAAPLLQQTTRPDAWDSWFRLSGEPPENVGRGVRYDQFNMISQAAVHGLGAAVLPAFLIEEELRTGRLVTIGPQSLAIDAGYYLVVPEEKTGLSTINAFRTWFLAAAGEPTELSAAAA
jgi:LysR family glycine cleavage system transcriptional activator